MVTAKNSKPAPRAGAKRALAKTARKAAIRTAATKPVAKTVTKTVIRASVIKAAAATAKRVKASSTTPVHAPVSNIVEAAAASAPIIDTLQKGPDMATTDTLKQNGEAATDRVQALFGDANGRAKTAIEKSAKIFEDVSEFAKGNVEAIVASGRVAAKGAEALGQDAAEYGKKSFEQASATMRSFAGVKSPTELFQLQSEFARTSFDAMVAESSKLSEAFLKLAGEIAQPLSNRFAVAADKVKSASAF